MSGTVEVEADDPMLGGGHDLQGLGRDARSSGDQQSTDGNVREESEVEQVEFSVSETEQRGLRSPRRRQSTVPPPPQ